MYSADVNPRTIRWQAGVTFFLLLLTLLIVGPRPVYWLAGLGLAWVVALNLRYAFELGDQGRPERRMYGDRWVARFCAVGLLLPLLIAIALGIFGFNPQVQIWDFTVNETATIVIAGALLFVLIICSSTIDWYYIRPRIDGVIREPPCRSSGSAWKSPTRWWYVHRGVATLAYFGFALTVAFVAMVMLVREHPAAAGVIGGVGGIASILLLFAGNYREQLFSAVGKFVLSPAFYLGDDLSFTGGRISTGRGFVLHVAIPVAKLVPLDAEGMPTGVPFIERRNSDLDEAELESRSTVACVEGCARMNPECVFGLERLDCRRRLLVL
jgi:hypothetical protein